MANSEVEDRQKIINENGPWPIPVIGGIIDKTTLGAMTPAAWAQLRAAVQAAARAGVARVNINAAAGPSGHKSHYDGTEWDIAGFNANGTLWTAKQRVAAAEGARSAGADRFGFYEKEGFNSDRANLLHFWSIRSI